MLGAFLEYPRWFGYHPESPGLGSVGSHDGTKIAIEGFAMGTSLFGIYMAYYWFRRHKHLEKDYSNRDEVVVPHVATGPRHFFLDGWGFDKLYQKTIVAPFVAVAQLNRADFVDSIYGAFAKFASGCHTLLGLTQTGRIRWYAVSIAVGTIIVFGMAVFA